jgi:chemotaxis protein methyltransferase CheR
MSTDQRKEREFSFTDKDFNYISKRVHDTVGIVLKDAKKDMVYSRIARRLRALALKSTTDYITYLEGPNGHNELSDFVNAITTNLTKFFREPHHFEHLGETFESISKRVNRPRKYRIWSAGCSAGMEAYSIAMVAQDKYDNIKRCDFKILATDIDTNMLSIGSDGEYRQKDIDEIEMSYKKRFVTMDRKKKEFGVMNDSLKSLVFFKELNLLHQWPMKEKFDVIFCRNVVIYFDKETQRVLFDKMADLLEVGAHLYIGHSENLSAVSDRFELLGNTVYRKVK